jgi:Heterokaryon incompatibility protein (HET)
MRLLKFTDQGQLSLTEFPEDNIPPYAILSHTWGADNEEVIFDDIMNDAGKSKEDSLGFKKILFCGEQAKSDGLKYFWVDTCCINKSSSQELSEAINSMFQWYQESAVCYVFLSDVLASDIDTDSQTELPSMFKNSRWFTRGWTLQELVAPTSVKFFSQEEKMLGDKKSLQQEIHTITGIAIQALRGRSLSQFTVEERMSWAQGRITKRKEDHAYCLLGIFDVHMPLLYSEGKEKALSRLHEEIHKASNGKSLNSRTFNDIRGHISIYMSTHY